MASPASPIADLTYRNYDGPLAPPVYRWWPIAKMTMRLAIKKKSFWVLGVLSGWWYLILSTIFYFSESLAPNEAAQKQFFSRVVWHDQFIDGFSRSQLFLLLVSLLIGVGAIANDNRTNALLVYLSKPCTKTDYLLGKWVGIFLPLLGIVAVPTLLTFAYWAMTYRQYGVLTDDPWLILKLIVLCPIAPAFYASIALGVSSLFDQGRTAGAVLAGIYFFAYIFTSAIGGSIVLNGSDNPLLNNAFYASIDGIQIGLAKLVIGSRGSVFFQGRRGGFVPPHIPSSLLFISLYFVVALGAVWIAWSRIRAVEVVGS